MPKKTKLAKNRLDKYYWLAKESGFRSRAAYKLLQLNKKFGFLKDARCVVDLCAAPGGWTQVAVKTCPLNASIVAVDLVQIAKIPGAHCLKGDITTQKTRQEILQKLKGRQADVVLNDGAPNVTGGWSKDAYSQCELSLLAAKLATQILRPQGTFITKVFRSQDYNPLLWALQQLFKKVTPFKPDSSRQASAETFLYCSGYFAPSKIDSRLLNPAFVFKQVRIPETMKKTKNVLKIKPKLKQKPNKLGYDTDNLHRVCDLSTWVLGESPVDALGVYHMFKWDLKAKEHLWGHPTTTREIKTCLADLKVLGRAEFKDLLKWRGRMRRILDKIQHIDKAKAQKDGGEGGKEEVKEDAAAVEVTKIKEADMTQEQKEEREIARQEGEVKELYEKMARDRKRRKKRLRRKKLLHRRTNAMAPKIDVREDAMLFTAGHFGDEDDAKKFREGHVEEPEPESEGSSSESWATEDELNRDMEKMIDELYKGYKKRRKINDRISKRGLGLASDDEGDKDSGDESSDEEGLEEALREPKKKRHPVLHDPPTAKESRSVKAAQWFSRTDMDTDLLADIHESGDEADDEEAAFLQDDSDVDPIVSDVAGPSSEDEADGVVEDVVGEKPSRKKKRGKKRKKTAKEEGPRKRARVSGKAGTGGGAGRVSKPRVKEFVASDDESDLGDFSSSEEEMDPREAEAKYWAEKEKETMEKLSKKGVDLEKNWAKGSGRAAKEAKKGKKKKEKPGAFKEKDFDRFEEVSEEESWSDSDTDAVAEVLAMGQRMLSKKERLRMIEQSYEGKFRFNDQKGLPKWFLDDERKHMRPKLPVTRREVGVFRDQLKAVNARPIKKVAEAKARKKLRAMRRWNKLRNSANVIADNTMLSEREKMRNIERIYAKGRKQVEKRKVQLVNTNSKKAHVRKSGVKMVKVDRRMKADKRHATKRAQRASGKKFRGKKASARLRAIQKKPWLNKKRKQK